MSPLRSAWESARPKLQRIKCSLGLHVHSEIWPGHWRSECSACGDYFDDDPS